MIKVTEIKSSIPLKLEYSKGNVMQGLDFRDIVNEIIYKPNKGIEVFIDEERLDEASIETFNLIFKWNSTDWIENIDITTKKIIEVCKTIPDINEEFVDKLCGLYLNLYVSLVLGSVEYLDRMFTDWKTIGGFITEKAFNVLPDIVYSLPNYRCEEGSLDYGNVGFLLSILSEWGRVTDILRLTPGSITESFYKVPSWASLGEYCPLQEDTKYFNIKPALNTAVYEVSSVEKGWQEANPIINLAVSGGELDKESDGRLSPEKIYCARLVEGFLRDIVKLPEWVENIANGRKA